VTRRGAWSSPRRSGILNAVGIRGRLALAVTVVSGLAALPGSAIAATSVGQVLPFPSACSNFVLIFQDAAGVSPSYTVPAPGVITSWSHYGRSGAAGSGKLVVFKRTAMADDFLVAAKSENRVFTPNASPSYPTRIPVGSGSLLGLYTTSDNTGCYGSTGNTSDGTRSITPILDPVVGDVHTFGPSIQSRRVNVSAKVEPDADHDGFGDESQDACPTDSALQAPCPAAVAPAVVPAVVPPVRKKKCKKKHRRSSSASAAKKRCKKPKK
jgi:hypothetical protein